MQNRSLNWLPKLSPIVQRLAAKISISNWIARKRFPHAVAIDINSFELYSEIYEWIDDNDISLWAVATYRVYSNHDRIVSGEIRFKRIEDATMFRLRFHDGLQVI